MRRLIYAKCPYCGYVNKWTLKIPKSVIPTWSVHYCDSDVGGCDQPFAVNMSVKIAIETHKIVLELGEHNA